MTPWIVAVCVAGAPWLARSDDASAPIEPIEPSEPSDAPIDEASGTGHDERSGETVVTATRRPRPRKSVPAAMVVVPRAEIDRSPMLTTDGLLRTVPSAATFRRSSSVTADPSSQGLNLRGLGPSGVSRSLVLVDGVPLNDPFGGWIYWRAVPRLALERIEVVPSGGSALWGSSALGGVVQMFTRPPGAQLELDGDLSVGTSRTGIAALRGSDRIGPVGAAVEGELFTSAGTYVVAAHDRGPIDDVSATLSGAFHATASAAVLPGLDVTARAGLFREQLDAGTRFTQASAEAQQASLTARWTGAAGDVDALTWLRAQTFEQRRARVAEGRVAESLAAEQRVPADEQGAFLQWTLPALDAHTLALGADVRRVAGVSYETLHPVVLEAGAPRLRAAGGEQRFAGLFVEDTWTPAPALTVTAAVRGDGWQSVGGHREVISVSGERKASSFDDVAGVELSPRVGVLLRPREGLVLRSSLYRAFRVPTLNELHRPFQVGTVLTAANPALAPEHVHGAELGFEVADRFAAVAVTGFWNELTAPIVNATLATPLPDGATRQRQNLGAASVRGVELSLQSRITIALSLLAAYTFVDNVVTAGPDELVGKRLPQDPLHRATVSMTWGDPRSFTATLAVRVLGEQFEDDKNTLPMAPVALVDGSLSRRLLVVGDGALELFVGVENVLNAEVVVGRAGVDTIGSPFMGRVGLRLRSAR